MKLTQIVIPLVALIGLACVPLTVSAQSTNTAAATAPTKAKKAAKTPYKGSITAIDTTANTVTIQGAKATMTLSITPTTKFQKDKAPAALTDFAVGDKVTGSFIKNADGTMSAASLHKKSAPAAAAAPATAPATQ